MKISPITQKGYQLLHEGAIELSHIEANGIRIDLTRLKQSQESIRDKTRELKNELTHTSEWKQWRKRYGDKASLTSHDQLATVLYSILGYEATEFTDAGKPSTDTEALQKIDNEFVKNLSTFLRYEKAAGTFLKGIEKETINGRLHPVFNLHTARTYRSSSDSPNFQNFPVRDKTIAKIIRSCFIASEDSVLVENDFKGIEVSVSACYHEDENFISYITTPGKDMHRDMAAQIYMLSPEDVSKDARYGAKNKFVFPQFYGDFYISCARALWEWIDRGKLTTPEGVSLYDHLREIGIRECGACDPEKDPRPHTFEAHIKEVEDDFWNNRFQAYGAWRKRWYKRYLDKGYFDLKTGFRIAGSLKKNAVTNYPIQGSAFHCLLWSLIRINQLLKKYQMKSMIVGQIHDSLIGDIRIKELRQYLEIVEHVTTVELRKHFKWINVPLEIEYEIAPYLGSWHDKQEVKFKAGKFKHPKKDVWTDDTAKFIKTLKVKE